MFEGATCGHTVEYTVVSLSVQKYRTEVEYTNIELWISEHCNGQQIVHKLFCLVSNSLVR